MEGVGVGETGQTQFETRLRLAERYCEDLHEFHLRDRIIKLESEVKSVKERIENFTTVARDESARMQSSFRDMWDEMRSELSDRDARIRRVIYGAVIPLSIALIGVLGVLVSKVHFG